MARKTLDELLKKYPEIDLEEVDITTNPLRAWKDGVRFIPTLKSGNNSLTGLFLSSAQLEDFLLKTR